MNALGHIAARMRQRIPPEVARAARRMTESGYVEPDPKPPLLAPRRERRAAARAARRSS